ncbi:MAG TPA: family 16 glycosylhydrolase [Polyangiaceae bacterium]
MKNLVKVSGFLAAVLCPHLCLAVGSAELYSSKAYGYGRFEARARFAPGDGVISAFFLWKDGSEKTGAFWNELDFEKVGAQCQVQSNAIYGNPSANHNTKHTLQADLCGAYHTYAYEWTADSVTWLVDGAVIRKDTGATAQAFADNASTAGMQFHFNIWPGDSTFGGNLDPSTLPVHQYIDWVQYSSYANGAFTLSWREDFTATTLPDGWLTGNWASPKNKSTHAPENVNFINGYGVLSLTADNALGPAGAMPGDSGTAGATSGAAGGSGAPASGGSSNASAGAPASGGSPGSTGTAGSSPSSAGSPGSPGSAGSPGSPGSAGSTSSAAGAGTLPSGGAPSTSGPSNGSTASSTDNGCSVGSAPTRGALWWALALPALALLRRRVRRSSVA